MLRMIPSIKVSFTNEMLVNIFRHNDSISIDSNKLKKALEILLKKNYNFNNFQNKQFKKFIDLVKKKNKFKY